MTKMNDAFKKHTDELIEKAQVRIIFLISFPTKPIILRNSIPLGDSTNRGYHSFELLIQFIMHR